MDSGNLPPAKRIRTDGNLDFVDESILIAAKDQQKWIEERRQRWPTRERIAQKKNEESLIAQSQESQEHTQQQSQRQQPHPRQNQNFGRSARKPVVCRYFLRGKCNSGPRCRFSHEVTTEEPVDSPPANRVYKRYEPPVKSSLFVKLVQTDHDAEDDRFLDFVQFLKNSNKLN